MNTPVSFEIAKLLNSKGLPGIKYFYDNKTHYKLNQKKYTIADVVMWLYDKHDIWVEVVRPVRETRFRFCVNKFASVVCFNSPTEAYEAAIKYTLEHIIK